MARRDPEVARLRALAKKRQRAAGQKISRLRAAGIDIANTPSDPRRPIESINRYNKSQLNAFIDRVNTFVLETRYTVDGSNARIPSSIAAQFNRMKDRFNQSVENRYAPVAVIQLPNNALTIREHDTEVQSRRARIRGGDTRRVMDFEERNVRNFTSAENVKKAIAAMKAQMAPGYYVKKLSEQRQQMMDMLKTIGNLEFMERAAALSDDQFNALWNYTRFANDTGHPYEAARLRAVNEKVPRHLKDMETNGLKDIAESLKWAEAIPQRNSAT